MRTAHSHRHALSGDRGQPAPPSQPTRTRGGPSDSTNKSPSPTRVQSSQVDDIPTMGWFSRMEPVDPKNDALP